MGSVGSAQPDDKKRKKKMKNMLKQDIHSRILLNTIPGI